VSSSFNNPRVLVQSWYVIARSREIRRGRAVSREILGRRVALYRGDSGKLYALGGRCAHLGADLGEGCVIGEELRCAFHHWTYGPDGRCVRIPIAEEIPAFARTFAYPTAEKYGLVWIFNGPAPAFPIPSFPGREEADLRVAHLPPQTLRCHPHVVAGNGLDVQHFQAVHGLDFAEPPAVAEPDRYRVQVRLKIRLKRDNLFKRVLHLLADRETVELTFTTWGGNLATIDSRVGPLPVLVLFTHRPLEGGGSASRTVLFLPRTRGTRSLLGADAVFLAAAKLLMARILVGDRRVLDSIEFQPHFLDADAPLARFVRQVGAMKTFDPSRPEPAGSHDRLPQAVAFPAEDVSNREEVAR
jgi:nitrite reductase/ring-hydroxylating ferredoxin subunit